VVHTQSREEGKEKFKEKKNTEHGGGKGKELVPEAFGRRWRRLFSLAGESEQKEIGESLQVFLVGRFIVISLNAQGPL